MGVLSQPVMWFRKNPRWQPYLVYGLLTLLVLAPMLKPGYILTLDMVFTPRLPMPDSVTPSYLFHLLLSVLSRVVPGDVIQKIILVVILLFSGVGMHRLMQHLRPVKAEQTEYETWGTYIAGMFYMINPYTYSRFMAGQYSVLLGYSLIPFFARALLRFLAAPTRKNVLYIAAWAVLVSIVSIHTVGLIVVLTIVAITLYWWRHRRQPAQIKAMWTNGLLGLAAIFITSCYWVIPLIAGDSTTAKAIENFGNADSQAFATVGGSALGKLGNIIRLQGFWAEGQQLYLLPQDRLPAWGLVGIIIWALVIFGGLSMWRRWKRSEVVIFAVAALSGTILAIGSFNQWLSDHLLFFSGYREPHKFVALVALAYAILLGQGVIALLHRYKKRRKELSASIAMGVLMILPLAFAPTMLWGFDGQLSPRDYPDDWYAMNDTLKQEAKDAKTVFLPWHLYSHYGFAGRIIASPAERFFETPMIVSDDPEFAGIRPAVSDSLKQKIGSELGEAPRKLDLGSRLAPYDVKYVLLAKEYDVENYAYLDYQQDLRLVGETDSLKLYVNDAFEE